MSNVVEIHDLRKVYPEALQPALDGLSLSVKAHTIFGLLGPNGAGKTTTLHILSGLIRSDSGSVSVFGLDAFAETDQIRRRIGVVPQHIALYPELNAWENLYYIGQLYGLSRASIKTRATLLLDRLGLMTHASKRVSRYSGGMKRRANIIASLLHEPELIILDEPTAGVDVQSRAMILDFLKDYCKAGRSIIYTSHLLEEAEQICFDVAIVDEGKFIIGGNPKQLIADTLDCRRLEDVFLYYTGHQVRD